MGKITISVDNTSDLGDELYKKYDLQVIYFGVYIGDKLYRDDEVKPDDIYNAVEKDGVVPKTNAALEVDYRELFEEATKDSGSIIHFSISSELSASHSNAVRAAKDMERVHVIDTKNASVGIGILAIRASELVRAGKSIKEIVPIMQDMVGKIDTSVIMNDIKYLHRGGRASGLKLLGANLLKIRPSLRVNEAGKVVPDRKFKGEFSRAVKEWVEYKLVGSVADKNLVFIVHTDIAEQIVLDTIQEYKKAGFKEIIRILIGPSLTTHVGRNAIGAITING
ncbi:MAG: DegV family protein [Firmicutes bacterium]|nr:DegV family protein [Bacillota bacterium]